MPPQEPSHDLPTPTPAAQPRKVRAAPDVQVTASRVTLRPIRDATCLVDIEWGNAKFGVPALTELLRVGVWVSFAPHPADAVVAAQMWRIPRLRSVTIVLLRPFPCLAAGEALSVPRAGTLIASRGIPAWRRWTPRQVAGIVWWPAGSVNPHVSDSNHAGATCPPVSRRR